MDKYLYYIIRFDFSEKEMNSVRWFRKWRNHPSQSTSVGDIKIQSVLDR